MYPGTSAEGSQINLKLLFQSNEKVTLVLSRKRSSLQVSHSRTKSAPDSSDCSPSLTNNTLSLSHKSVSCDSLTPVPPHHAATINLHRDFTSQELQHKSVTINKVNNKTKNI